MSYFCYEGQFKTELQLSTVLNSPQPALLGYPDEGWGPGWGWSKVQVVYDKSVRSLKFAHKDKFEISKQVKFEEY